MLSVIAVLGAATIVKDAILYIDVGNVFLEQGFAEAYRTFNWPWFSLLLAASHWLTGISMEACAYFWCFLFMAGACALAVDFTRRWVPGSGYLACLVVLAAPGFNQFRGQILREFGFWFFCILAFWLADRWRTKGGWGRSGLVYLAIVLAALFRLEAIVLMPALLAWQVFGARDRSDCMRALHLGSWSLLMGGAALLVLAFIGDLSVPRLEYYLDVIDPRYVLASFQELSSRLAEGMRFKYSRDDAGQIVFFGMLGVLLIKFLAGLGPLCVPLASFRAWREVPSFWRVYGGFAWAWIAYFLMLMVAFIHNQFIISRYSSFLDWLAVPLVTVVLWHFVRIFPRLGKVILLVALLAMADNVISLGAKKTHYVEAGIWLAENVQAPSATYYEDVRISYYAGWGGKRLPLDRDAAMSPEHAGMYRYFAIEAEGHEPWLQDWLAERHKRVLAKFSNAKGDSVLVLGD